MIGCQNLSLVIGHFSFGLDEQAVLEASQARDVIKDK